MLCWPFCSFFPAKTVNCQVSGYFSKKSRQNCRFSGWYGTPCSQPCIIDAFIGVFLIIQNIPGNAEAVPAILFFGRLYGFFWSVKIQIDNYCIFPFFHLTFLLFCLHKIRRILDGKVAVLIKIIFFFQSKQYTVEKSTCLFTISTREMKYILIKWAYKGG